MTFHKGHPYSRKNKHSIVLFLSATILVIGVLKITNSLEKNSLLSPLASNSFSQKVYASEPITSVMSTEDIIRFYALEYGVDPEYALCVAKNESGYRKSAVGDGGKAIGVWQFHAPTYRAFRKRMGLSQDDSRTSVEESTKTAMWAFSQGLSYHWSATSKCGGAR